MSRDGGDHVAEAFPGARRAEEWQNKAAEPDASAWVSASAGTGKTSVLVRRLQRLLLSGVPPERILCLTYTRAAAAEMAIRLNDELRRWATSDGDTLLETLRLLTGTEPDGETCRRARQLYAVVADAPGGMAIDTLHAFCQSLLRRFPLEAGEAPNFALAEERDQADLLADARRAVLAREAGMATADGDGEEGPSPDSATGSLAAALDIVAQQVGEADFANLMRELTAQRGRLAQLLAADGRARMTARLRQRLGVAEEATADQVRAMAVDETAFDGVALRRAAAALLEGSKTDCAAGQRMADWLAAGTAERIAGLADYRLAFFTQSGTVRKSFATKATSDGMPDIVTVMAEEAGRLDAVQTVLKGLDLVAATDALLAIGEAIVGEYERHKAMRGLLDYDDLILAARNLLDGEGAAAWVLFKLDGGIDHVLIDEAQDTSPDQWRIITALADEYFAAADDGERRRTLFAVGDRKQSIFSFQGADPDAFDAMHRRFHDRAKAIDKPWHEVPLTISFRSTVPVLRAVDAVFAQARAAEGVVEGVVEDGRDGAGRLRHEASRIGQAGLVEVWPAVPPADDSADQAVTDSGDDEAVGDGGDTADGVVEDSPNTAVRLAWAIAGRVARWLRDGEHLESRGRRLRAGDIMVLVQRRTIFVEELIRALRTLDVPVAGSDRLVLTDHLAVMDLMALGHFLLMPDDDMTLATVLKGPFGGLDDSQLFDLAWDRGGESLWRRLATAAHRADDQSTAFGQAHERLARLLGMADFRRPYELFAAALAPPPGAPHAASGRQRLLARLGPDAADAIDEFMSLALAYERGHPPSLQGFLHWLAAGGAEVRRDMERAVDAVRVMTVHGAKGLQAPVVFMAETLQSSRASPNLLWWMDGDLPDLVWAPRRDMETAAVTLARAAADRNQRRESRRLLYVAMTRAADRLYVCGYQTARQPVNSWYELVRDGMAGLADVATVEMDFAADLAPAALPGLQPWSGPGLRLHVAQTAAAEAESERPAGVRRALPDWARQAAQTPVQPPVPLTPSGDYGSGDDLPADQPEAEATSPQGAQAMAFERGHLVHRLLELLPAVPPAARSARALAWLAATAERMTPTMRQELVKEVIGVLEHPATAPLFGGEGMAEAPVVGMVDSRAGRRAVSGRIDRLAVLSDRVIIADYKSGTPPPAGIAIPPAYTRQMALYRAVLAPLFPDRPVDCAVIWTFGPRVDWLSPEEMEAALP
ncbi:MAG: double-strand break repair helicase AddA [Alphaproteobacteria bacterium]